MRKRNLVFLILIAIGVALLIISQHQNEKKKNMHNYIFKDLKFNNINSIFIKNYTGSKGFTFVKDKKGNWFIKEDNTTCNKYRIEYLINLLKDTDFTNIISSKKENYKNFNVDDNNSITVKIVLNKKTISIWIGKFTPDGNGCYVRLEDGNVYLITKNLTLEFDKDKKYFHLEKNKKNK